MMLHRHFEAMREEAKQPASPVSKETLTPVKDVQEGEDMINTSPAKAVKSSRKK